MVDIHFEDALLRRIAREPSNVGAWLELGRLRQRDERKVEALQAYEAALSAGASPRSMAFDYALLLSDLGSHEQAERVVREALGRRPRLALVNLLGVILKRAGKLREAIPLFEQAHALDPKSHSPWINLGNVYFELGEWSKAVDAYNRATRLRPNDAETWRLLGRAQQSAGGLEEARSSLRRALTLMPGNLDAILDLVGVHLTAHRLAEALEIVGKALARDPANSRVQVARARVLRRMGRLPEARALLEAVLVKDAVNAEALLMLARICGDADRREANDLLRRLVALRPTDIEPAIALCDSLNRSRYDSEADHIQAAYDIAVDVVSRFGVRVRPYAKELRAVLGRCVDFERYAQTGTLADLGPMWIAAGEVTALHWELGSVRSFDERLKLVQWHGAWGRQVAARARPLPPPLAPAMVGSRKIRIGLMSSDLRSHPVGYFALPLLEYDRERFELYCYSFNNHERDALQARFESRSHAFRWWPGRSAEAAAAGIASDELDVLFELGGTTAMNKIEVMAYRPARITASWLGYPHSVGLETIDRIVVDPWLNPEDARLLIERPLELADSWVTVTPPGFRPVPVIPDPPADRNGYLTFGTMNNPYKYKPAVFDAWARVMHETSGSRFLFVRPEGSVPAFRRNVLAQFAARGIEPERIAFEAVRGKHLPYYNAIDISLDTFPHVGGTTTCETLWMGVPAVTLVGPAFYERMSYSNLVNAGLGDLCARSVDEYVAIASGLAADKARLRALRSGLRDDLRRRPLGDAPRFVNAFYQAAGDAARE